MIPNLIRLGVEKILKIICEKITIKSIRLVNKKGIFNGKIEQLFISAESIIFNKINISKIIIRVNDLVIKFALNKNILFIDKCYAVIHLRLSKENINETLFYKKWNKLKTLIESYILMGFESIEIKDKSIFFISSDGDPNSDIFYSLEYEKNTISLINNINQKKLTILNDKNVTINNLFFNESSIDLELSSKISLNK